MHRRSAPIATPGPPLPPGCPQGVDLPPEAIRLDALPGVWMAIYTFVMNG